MKRFQEAFISRGCAKESHDQESLESGFSLATICISSESLDDSQLMKNLDTNTEIDEPAPEFVWKELMSQEFITEEKESFKAYFYLRLFFFLTLHLFCFSDFKKKNKIGIYE